MFLLLHISRKGVLGNLEVHGRFFRRTGPVRSIQHSPRGHPGKAGASESLPPPLHDMECTQQRCQKPHRICAALCLHPWAPCTFSLMPAHFESSMGMSGTQSLGCALGFVFRDFMAYASRSFGGTCGLQPSCHRMKREA